jgi:LPS sulfotransferase NodH
MNFFILARPRTGSTMLTNFLNTQPDIACESEIFHHVGITFPHIKSFTHWTAEWLVLNGKDLQTAIKNKFLQPEKFFKFLKGKNNKKIVGYKVVFPQLVFFKNNFKFLKLPRYEKTTSFEHKNLKFSLFNNIKKNNGKVILLRRKNEFLRCLSALKSWKTNDPIIEKDVKKIFYKKNDKKVIFNINYYLKGVKDVIEGDAEIEAFLKKSGIPYFIVYYEDLTGPESNKHYCNVATFLGQSKEKFVAIKNEELDIKKLNTYTLESQIKNYKRVFNVLKDDVYFQNALLSEKKLAGPKKKI